MRVAIEVPVMGESVSEAIVSNFLVSQGSFVKQGQELLELETDKVNQVLYAKETGKVTYEVSQGQTVKVGETIGYIDTEALASEEPTQAKEPLEEKPAVKEDKGGARVGMEAFIRSLTPPQQEPYQTKEPLAYKEEKAERRTKMSLIRKTISERLVQVKNQTAMLTTFNEVDMSSILEIRARDKEAFEARYGVKLGFMSFFVKACLLALKEFPLLHSFIEVDEIVTPLSYDIGVAVSTDKGLFVPVIRDCEHKCFGEIEQEIAQLARKAREGKITMQELQGGSFTLTNGGVFGSLLSTPILNPPQSAILGMHSIVKRPVAIEDKVEIRPMMYLALSYDHRIVDGREAVLFLVKVKEALEDPAKLLLDL